MALNQIEMFFFGLICHVGRNDMKDFALLVDDVEHKPEVVVGDGSGAFTAITLNKGDKISLNIPQGAANGSPISGYAPHLSKLVKRNDGTTPTIKREKALAMLTAYPLVENEDGTTTAANLEVAFFYDDQAIYKLDGTTVEGPHCVPQILVLKFTSKESDIAVFVNGVLRRSVPPNGWILFADRSTEEGQHFERHRTLTDANVAGTVEPYDTCDKDPVETQHGDTVYDYLYANYHNTQAEVPTVISEGAAASSVQGSPAIHRGSLTAATLRTDTASPKFTPIDRTAAEPIVMTSILQQVECSNTNWP